MGSDEGCTPAPSDPHTLNLNGKLGWGVSEQLVIAAAFLAIYFILPQDTEYTAYVDIRALPIVVLFVIFAMLRMLAETSGGRRGQMLFDFSEAERNTTRRALEIYVTELREEIVKTEKHEWREALHLEKRILEGVIEQLSV